MPGPPPWCNRSADRLLTGDWHNPDLGPGGCRRQVDARQFVALVVVFAEEFDERVAVRGGVSQEAARPLWAGVGLFLRLPVCGE